MILLRIAACILFGFLLANCQEKERLFPFEVRNFKESCNKVFSLISQDGIDSLDEFEVNNIFRHVSGLEGYAAFLICQKSDSDLSPCVNLFFPTVFSDDRKIFASIGMVMNGEIKEPITRSWSDDLPLYQRNRIFLLRYDKDLKVKRMQMLENESSLNRVVLNKILLGK